MSHKKIRPQAPQLCLHFRPGPISIRQLCQFCKLRTAPKIDLNHFAFGSPRNGQCRIVSSDNYSALPKEKLKHAIKAFEAALEEDVQPRLR